MKYGFSNHFFSLISLNKNNFYRTNLFVKLLLLFSSLIVSMGCENRVSKENLSHKVDDTVQSFSNSKSYEDWAASNGKKQILFQEVTNAKDSRMNEEFCQILKRLSVEDVLAFEQEIYSNEKILETCQTNLEDVLYEHFEEERKSFEDNVFSTPSFSRDQFHKLKSNIHNMSLEDLNQFMSELTISQYNGEKIQTKVVPYSFAKGAYITDAGLKDGEVMITMDDGPSALTPIALQTFKQFGAKVTFFELGMSVERLPKVSKLVANEGHSLGNHSYNHAYMGYCSRVGKCPSNAVGYGEAVTQFRRTHQILFDTVGFVDPFVRFPYGAATKELKNFLKANSIGEFFWNIDPEDWKKGQSSASTLNRIMSQLNKVKKGVILLHDIHRGTIELLPQLMKNLIAEKYTLVILRDPNPDARTKNPLLSGSGPK